MPFTLKARMMQIDFCTRYFIDHETKGDLAASALGAGYSPKYVRNNRQRLQRILDAEGKRRQREAMPACPQLPANTGRMGATWHRIKNALGGYDLVRSIPEPERPTAEGEVLEGEIVLPPAEQEPGDGLPEWVRGNAPSGQGQQLHFDAKGERTDAPSATGGAPSYEQRHDNSALGLGHVEGQTGPSQDYLDAIANEQRKHSPEYLEAQQGFHLDGQDPAGDAAAGLGPQARPERVTLEGGAEMKEAPPRFTWWQQLGAAARRYFSSK